MNKIKEIIEHMDDTLDEIQDYYEDYLMYCDTDKKLAQSLLDVGIIHLSIYDKLHNAVVEIINTYKREKGDIPKEMQMIYEYEHKRVAKRFNELKHKMERL